MMRELNLFYFFIFLSFAANAQTSPVLNSSSSWWPTLTMKPFQYDSKCSTLYKKSNFSFSSFDPMTLSVNGTTYPRNDFTLYRSFKSKDDFDVKSFLRAATGDKTSFYRNFAFQLIQKGLAGELSDYENSKLGSYIRTYYDQAKYDLIKACVANIPDEEKNRESALAAAEVLNDVFSKHQANNVIERRYLDYKSNQNIDYWYMPRFTSPYRGIDMLMGRGEIIFSTNNYVNLITYPYDFKVILRERERRSIDLNYWNYFENGQYWNYHINDADEFITPGFYAPSDIIGFVDGPRSLMYLKVVYNNENYIVVTDDGNIYSITTNPVLSGSKRFPLNLYGIIVPCDPASSCTYPDGITSYFSKSIKASGATKRSIVKAVDDANQYAVNGKLEFIEPGAAKTITVIKALYGGQDIKNKMSAFCDGKSSCGYKFKHSYVFDTVIKDFHGAVEVEYYCKDKNQVIKSELADPAENLIMNLSCL